MVFQFGTSLDKERKPEQQTLGTTSTSRRIQEYQDRGDNCAMDLADMIKNKYRGLECQGCLCFMGYQHRYDPSIVVCSGVCMLEVDQKIQAYKGAGQRQADGSFCKGTCGSANPSTLGMPPPYMQQPHQPSLLGAPPGMQLVPIPNPYGLPGFIYAYVPTGFVPPMPIPPPMVHPQQPIQKSEPFNSVRRYHPSNCGNSGGSSGATGSSDHSPTLSSGQFSNGQAQPVDSSTPKLVENQNGFAETSSSTMDGSIDNSPIQFSPRSRTEAPPLVDSTGLMLLKRKEGKEQVKRVLNLNGEPPSVEIPKLKETATPMSANLLDVASSEKGKSNALVEETPKEVTGSETMKTDAEPQVEAAINVALPQAEADTLLVVIKSSEDFNERPMALAISNNTPVKIENEHMSPKPDIQKSKPVTTQHVKTQVAKKITTTNKNLLKNIVLSTSLYEQAECFWNYIWTPTKFTLTANADAQKIAEMGDRMKEYCDEAPGMTRMPIVGEIVYAPYDGIYYRAVVVKRNLDKKTLKVEFVDFGDCVNLSLEDCREPSVEINYPIFGITMHLTCDQQFPPEVQQEVMDAIETTFKGPVYIHLEKKIDEFNWIGELYLSTKSDDTISKFLNAYVWKKQLAEEETVKQDQVQSSKPSNSAVAKISEAGPSKLECKSDTESVSSKKRQVFKKRKDDDSVSVVSTKHDEAPKKKTQSATPDALKPRPEPTLKTKQQPVAEKKTEVPLQSKPCVAKHDKSPNTNIPKNPDRLSSLLIQDAEFSKALKHSAVVKINYMFTMGRLLVFAVKDEDNLAKLTMEIENYVTKAPGLNRMPVVNEILIAPYQGVYYRGKVVTSDEQYATIRFLDYGDQEKVPITEMKEIPDSIRKIPIYGIELVMVGVPSDIPFFESKLIETIYEKSAQLQLLEKVEPGVFKARLWFGSKDDANWASIVNAEYTTKMLMKKAVSK